MASMISLPLQNNFFFEVDPGDGQVGLLATVESTEYTIGIEYRKYKQGSHPFSSPVPGKECAGATDRAAEI